MSLTSNIKWESGSEAGRGLMLLLNAEDYLLFGDKRERAAHSMIWWDMEVVSWSLATIRRAKFRVRMEQVLKLTGGQVK